MRMKKKGEKADLKLSIKKSKIMPFGPISSWQKEGEKVEAMSDFTFLGSKITVDSDCNHQVKRGMLLERKAMKNLYSVLISTDISLSTSICIVKAIVFPVVMHGHESWTIKTTECQRIDVFELWFWRRLLRVPCTARRSNQSILKEINP